MTEKTQDNDAQRVTVEYAIFMDANMLKYVHGMLKRTTVNDTVKHDLDPVHFLAVHHQMKRILGE